jgi:hypothetical protein
VTDDEQAEQVRDWFAEKGFDLRVELREAEYVVDLVSRRTGDVIAPSYGGGPTPNIAIVVTEQRWLVEQDGSGSVTGATYVAKAEERLRRGRAGAP